MVFEDGVRVRCLSGSTRCYGRLGFGSNRGSQFTWVRRTRRQVQVGLHALILTLILFLSLTLILILT